PTRAPGDCRAGALTGRAAGGVRADTDGGRRGDRAPPGRDRRAGRALARGREGADRGRAAARPHPGSRRAGGRRPGAAAAGRGRRAEVRVRLATVGRVRAPLGREAARFPRLAAVAASLGDLAAVREPLERTLDEMGLVRDDASPELASARAVTRELRHLLEARLEQLVRDPDLARAGAEQYVTIRNRPFVVPIRTAAVNSVPGIIADRSGSGETVFLEPLFAVDLNNRLLLAARDEEAEERRVRAELTALVRSHATELTALEA